MTGPLLPGEKPLFWVGSSLKNLRSFPEPVRTNIGFALAAAQFGGEHPAAKPWKGEGPGLLEIVSDHDGNAFRAVYTVRFTRAIYVLHAFQKKSPHGIVTSRLDVALIHERLRLAQEDYTERYG